MVHVSFPRDWHIHIHRQTDGVHALYANFFLRELAIYTFGLFEPLYLLKLAQDFLDLAFPQVLVFICGFYLAERLLYILFVLPAANLIYLIGTRWSIFISNLFLLLYLGALTLAAGEFTYLAVAVLAGGIYIPLYYLSFHYLLCADSHTPQRGREVGMTRVFERIGAIVGPLLGGIFLKQFGFIQLFLLASVLVVISSIPPFFMYHHQHERAFSWQDIWAIARRAKNWGVLASVSAAGLVRITDDILLPLFAFILFAGYAEIGFFYAVTGLLTIGVYWLVGWLFDTYSRSALIKTGALLKFCVWVGRALTFSPLLLYFVELVKRFAHPMLEITHDALVYHWGRKEPLAYMLVRSLFWQLGAAVWLSILIVGFWWGLSIRVFFLLTALAVWGHLLILKR